MTEWKCPVIKALNVIRILSTTFSMCFVTHVFVFMTLPFAILISVIDKDTLPTMRRWFMKVLFAIVGRKLKITGYANVQPDRAYLIISNSPSFYAGFTLMGVFPRASVVVRAFMKRIPLLG
jgi:1-acyl-sn-glycerol-3-phosphate acyltransferase